MVVIGNILYTLSVKLFVLPVNLMSCGTTGIALVLNHFLNMGIKSTAAAVSLAVIIAGIIMGVASTGVLSMFGL